MEYDISVIMGFYNNEKTLAAAIDSLLNQTYQNWKLILCDDGSTDGSFAIAKEYAERYDNLVLIQNERNRGVGATLNHCLEYVDTKYVAKMDSDDICTPDRLEKEVAFLKEHPDYAVVSCDMICFDEEGQWGRTHSKADPEAMDFMQGSPFCHGCSMTTAEAYRAVGGYTIHKRLDRIEDFHLWIKIYCAGYKGHNLPEALYWVRENRSAFSRRKYTYRINEAYVRFLAVRDLHLPAYGYIYVLRPLLVGLMPGWMYSVLHKWRIHRLHSEA